MKKMHLILAVSLNMIFHSCTTCTECDYEYVLPVSMDTVRGSQEFCGSNKTVSDFEDYYDSEIQRQAALAGAVPRVGCTRFKK
jgi:hypothetical protein